MNRLYGFTYKINTNPPPKAEDYSKPLEGLRRKGELIHWNFENDKKGRLHVHGLILFTRLNPYFAHLFYKGVSARFEKIYEIYGWTKYMTKDSEDPAEEYDIIQSKLIELGIITVVCPSGQSDPDQDDIEWFKTNYAFV